MQPGEHFADLILSAAIDDQLTLEEARQMNVHLETCAVCRARLDDLRSVVGLLQALPTLEVPRDFSLGPRRLADPPNVVRLRRWYGFARAGAASLAAAFVFLFAGALYVDSQPGTSTGGLSAQSQFASAPAPAAPQSGAAAKSAPVPAQDAAQAPAAAQAAPAVAPRPAAAPAAGQGAPVAPAAPAAAQAAPAAAPAAAAAQAAPGAAPSAEAAPAALAVRSQAAPSTTGAEVADQVTAATSVRPLPTPVPTLAPIPTRAPPQVALQPVTATRADSPSPLRIAATSVGILAVVGAIATLVIRRRLRAAAIPPTE